MSDSLLPQKSRADLDLIIKEAEAIEAKYAGQPMPDAEGTKLANLYKEGESLSVKINEEMQRQQQMAKMKRAQAFLGEVPNPTLPNVKDASEAEPVAGYITPGDFVALSQEYQETVSRGFRKNHGINVDIKGGLLPIKGRSTNGLIALTETELKALKGGMEAVASRYERKDLPVVGELVIAPARVDRFVQDTRPDMLTLRDVLNVSPTSSPLIQYVAEVTYTEGAAIQSEGLSVADTAAKGESDIEYELRDATVRTVATTIPVSEQMLADAPALVNRINTRLLHDVRKKEEQLCGYGSGTGLEFAGFFDSDSDVDAGTSTGGDTLIDKIRRAQTDIMTAGYSPTFVWIHPIDWETIELLKGSDGDFYIWAVIRDNLGPRIWSMRVVQGVGTKKVGAATRNVLVGSTEGAVLYDREQANIAVGWVDDQFTKNLRTIRAEERVVLCIDAPAAFRKINTVA